MNDPRILAGAMAFGILLVFLLRFYRRHVRPGFKRGNRIRALTGVAIIIASILLSIWWRNNVA